MHYTISVDPGAVHCGVAYWTQHSDEKWECQWAVEMTPEDCVDYVKRSVESPDQPDQVIVEGFWLKPGLDAIRQAGSQMETTEVIGTIRHLCRWAGVPFQKVANGQQATIKRLNSRKYVWSSFGHGDHAKDAEAVGVRGLELKIRDLRRVNGK